MKLAVKSLPSDYPPDPTVPNGVGAETPPKLRNFWCACGELVQTRPIPQRWQWHYRTICPECGTKYSNLYRRFARQSQSLRTPKAEELNEE